MKKLLTLFTLLLTVCSGAWATDVEIPLTNLKLFPLDYGLVTIANTNDKVSIASNQLQVSKATGTFSVSTNIAGVYLKSISFTDANSSKNGGFTCTDNDSYMTGPTENVYTYTAPNTTTTEANFQLIGSGGTAKMGTIIITVSTSDQVERLSSFGSISENKIPFTSSAATSNIELSVPNSNAVGTGSGRISIGSGGKHLIVSAKNNKLIKKIAIPKYQQSTNEVTCSSTPGGTYSNNIWTPTGSSVESVDLTLTVSSTTYSQEIFVIYESAAPGAINFNPVAGSVEEGSSITLSSTGATEIKYQWGASEVDGEGNWDGATTYSNETKPVVPAVGSSNNVLSVWAHNNDGDTYGSAAYTITAAKTVTTTTINVPGGFNTDVKTSTTAGTLTASVTAGGSPVGGATVTWASSDESIVKVGETTGVVTLVAAGDANITATYAGDETYAASFDVYAIEVVDTRKQVTLSFSTVSLIDYNYDGETLTAPTLTAKDQNENTIDLAELPELSFAVDKEDVVTVNAETGVITAANTNNFGTSTVTVSFPGNSNYKSAASKSYTVTRAPMLYQVKFDNGFEGFIEEGTKKVNVFYMAGTSAPAQTGTIKKAEGYTADVVGNTVVLTKDTHTKTYNIVATAKIPFEGAGKQTFSAVPDYVASVYGFEAGDGKKRLKYSKKLSLNEGSTDWTREAKGNSRLYFFVGAATNIAFTHTTNNNAVKVRINGGEAVEKSGSFNIDLNADQPNMIEIQSNQTSGDGGFKDITLTNPKKAINISSAGYATFSSTEKLDFTDVDGLTAYKATATGESSVTLKDVTGIVPAETGLLLKGDAKTYYIPMSTETATADVDGNLLQSTATAEYEVTGSETGTAYVFGKLVDEVGFFKAAAGKKIGVGKSWLLVPGTGAKDVEFLSFVFGDEEQGETDDIKAVSTKVEKGVRYNLAGQKVGADYKGIVIVNGKKVIIK